MGTSFVPLQAVLAKIDISTVMIKSTISQGMPHVQIYFPIYEILSLRLTKSVVVFLDHCTKNLKYDISRRFVPRHSRILKKLVATI